MCIRDSVHPTSRATVACFWTTVARREAAAGDCQFDARGAREFLGVDGPDAVKHDGDLASGPLELTLARGEQWFVRVAQGGVLTASGAGEVATAP
eukprot:11598896-Alexandrium_andersonii.AAC.1